MKKWYASKTLWFNIAALIFAVLGNFGYTGNLPAEWALFVPAIVAIVNMVLRLITNKAVSL